MLRRRSLPTSYIGSINLGRDGPGEEGDRDDEAMFSGFLDEDAGNALKRAVANLHERVFLIACPSGFGQVLN
ncbi:MAG TPA: hypothetical protein VMZ31_13475 [Phycisphaerae bacterium]|nr:hypothetical protein [Phycisphaerae bacterium]